MRKIRLSGDWQVDDFTVPECAHLQPVLHPDNPYWGNHLRAVNERVWVYRKCFTLPPEVEPGLYRRARLLFEGVDYFASVQLNGRHVGDHEGHFAPFAFDVTDDLADHNDLTVHVSSPWDNLEPGGIFPVAHVKRGMVKGSYEHGEGLIPPNVNPLGIWRPVWLVLDDGISIDHVRIETALDGRVSLRLRVTTIEARAVNIHLNIQPDNHDGPGITATLQRSLTAGTHEITHTLHIPQPRLWWPWDHGEPNLYRLETCLYDESGPALDGRHTIFGVRTTELERHPDRFVWRVNGREVFIRGVSYMPGLYLSEVEREQIQADLQAAQDAHLNLIRVHVHVAPPEVYDLCNRMGLLVWQDFELNWRQDDSLEFESRARHLQREMMDMLFNHPAIIAWTCHNEPTMVLSNRQNLRHPDEALYADAIAHDPTRTVFMTSGQLDDDWRRSGDAHPYFGGIWSACYTNIHGKRYKLVSEYGFETPAHADTLREYPQVWARLNHLEGQIAALWDYQAEIIRYQTEYFRRLRVDGCAGYVAFWLVDLVPQVGCGLLDSSRRAKGGYAALMHASRPLHIALEHDGTQPIAVWVFNDTLQAYHGAKAVIQGYDGAGQMMFTDSRLLDVAANVTQQVGLNAAGLAGCDRVTLALYDSDGSALVCNDYDRPFQITPRPAGYPWNFDPYLGCKVFNRLDSVSLSDVGAPPLVKWVPRRLREAVAEWTVRQDFPPWLLRLLT